MIPVQITWEPDDHGYSAVFVRDGQPWYLDGALVGMGITPGGAVEDLVETARLLVEQGADFPMGIQQISLDERVWLFKLLDNGPDVGWRNDVYGLLRSAGWRGF